MDSNTKNVKNKEMRDILLKEFYNKNRLLDTVINVMIVISSLLEISISWIMQFAINSISDRKPLDEFLFAILFAVIVLASITAVSYILERLKNSFVEKFSVFVKNKLFNLMLEKDIVDFEKLNSGEYLSVYQTDILRLSSNYVFGKWIIISSFSICILGVVSMITMSLKLSLLVLGLQMIPILITLILGKKLTVYEKKCAEARGTFSSETQDYLKGFRLIKTFSSKNVFVNKFMYHNKTVEEAAKNLRNKSIVINMVNLIANYVMIIGLFLIGGIESLKGRMKIGTVIACFELLNTISDPFSSISNQINLVRTANAIFERIYKIFFVSSEGKSLIQKETDNQVKIDKLNSIELRNVSFSYDNAKNTLNDINCCICDGKKYAIVGNSGSGKTTMLKLLLGYYDNYEGDILFNDCNLKEIGSEQINKNISIVQQDVFVFNDTVMANITLNTDFEKKDIDFAIEKSGLTEFVRNHGEDYICGEGGKNLSGGEKQRISIARALLRNSGIIFFDEATSSLDNLTALEIENTINSLDRTCVVITHKLDLEILRKYDQILVFADGEIVEKGTVDELMTLNGEFCRLYT